MAYIGKTNWQNNEIVEASDMNRIEQGVTNNDAGLTTHTALTTAHSAVATPTANRLMLRDANGRAQVAAPSVAADIARLDTVTTHTALTNTAHGAVSAPTINTLIARDASGRAQVAAPSVAADIARLDTVTTHEALTSPHSAVSTPTASRLIVRDANGRAQVVDGAVAADIATWAQVNSRALLAVRNTEDLNTIVQGGMYRFQNTNPNRPPGVEWGQLLVVHGGSDTILQITSDITSGRIFWRSGNPPPIGGSGSWHPWREIWHSGRQPDWVSVTASRNLLLEDMGLVLNCNSASAIVLTIQPDATTNFPAATEIAVLRYGTGAVTFAAGSGVTIRSRGGLLSISAQFATASLKKIAGNEWLLAGALA